MYKKIFTVIAFSSTIYFTIKMTKISDKFYNKYKIYNTNVMLEQDDFDKKYDFNSMSEQDVNDKIYKMIRYDKEEIFKILKRCDLSEKILHQIANSTHPVFEDMGGHEPEHVYNAYFFSRDDLIKNSNHHNKKIFLNIRNFGSYSLSTLNNDDIDNIIENKLYKQFNFNYDTSNEKLKNEIIEKLMKNDKLTLNDYESLTLSGKQLKKITNEQFYAINKNNNNNKTYFYSSNMLPKIERNNAFEIEIPDNAKISINKHINENSWYYETDMIVGK